MPEDNGSMGREDRRDRVLAVLEDSGAAMKAVDVFRNAKLRGADFERRSVNTYLRELIDSGQVRKIDTDALNDGKIEDIDPSDRGHFIAASAAADFADE